MTKAAQEFNKLSDTEKLRFVPDGRPGAAAIRAQQKKILAVVVGTNYHNNIGSLANSSRAVCLYGCGGTEEVSWDVYAKSYRYPCRWKNYGARLNGDDIIVENSRGNVAVVVNTQLLPLGHFAQYEWNPLVDGELFGIERRNGVRERYAPVFKRCKSPSSPQKSCLRITGFKATGISWWTGTYWEHGKTLKECVAEFQRKEKIKRLQENPLTPRENKVLRRALRVCKQTEITRTDVQSAGACDVGITAYVKRHNIKGNTLKLAAVPSMNGFLKTAFKNRLLAEYRKRHATG